MSYLSGKVVLSNATSHLPAAIIIQNVSPSSFARKPPVSTYHPLINHQIKQELQRSKTLSARLIGRKWELSTSLTPSWACLALAFLLFLSKPASSGSFFISPLIALILYSSSRALRGKEGGRKEEVGLSWSRLMDLRVAPAR